MFVLFGFLFQPETNRRRRRLADLGSHGRGFNPQLSVKFFGNVNCPQSHARLVNTKFFNHCQQIILLFDSLGLTPPARCGKRLGNERRFQASKVGAGSYPTLGQGARGGAQRPATVLRYPNANEGALCGFHNAPRGADSEVLCAIRPRDVYQRWGCTGSNGGGKARDTLAVVRVRPHDQSRRRVNPRVASGGLACESREYAGLTGMKPIVRTVAADRETSIQTTEW